MNDIEKTRRFLASPLLRKVFPLLFVGVYAIGLVLLLMKFYGVGLLLWLFSTVGGALLLYTKKTKEKLLADLLRVEAEEEAYQAQLKAQKENA